jgi:hypothetical protein
MAKLPLACLEWVSTMTYMRSVIYLLRLACLGYVFMVLQSYLAAHLQSWLSPWLRVNSMLSALLSLVLCFVVAFEWMFGGEGKNST